MGTKGCKGYHRRRVESTGVDIRVSDAMDKEKKIKSVLGYVVVSGQYGEGTLQVCQSARVICVLGFVCAVYNNKK